MHLLNKHTPGLGFGMLLEDAATQRATIVKYLFGPVVHHLISHLSRTLQPWSEKCGVQRVHERFLLMHFVDFEFSYLAFGMFYSISTYDPFYSSFIIVKITVSNTLDMH